MGPARSIITSTTIRKETAAIKEEMPIHAQVPLRRLAEARGLFTSEGETILKQVMST
jgi:hypothetical protein